MYGKGGAATGPTLTGCELSADKKSITISFNQSMFAGDTLEVTDYTKTNTSQVRLNSLGISAHKKPSRMV